MNLYFLLEDSGGGKKVYRAWLKHCFPQLSERDSIAQVEQDNFYLLSGNGYPSYLKRIPDALQDIQTYGGIDHFFICIDTEEDSPQEKREEIQAILDNSIYFRNTHIILHHCCMETWFLGHTAMLKTHPTGEKLRTYKAFYDVSMSDPEEMPCHNDFDYKAQFHLDYLQAMLHEHHSLHYNKKNPGVVADQSYLQSLVQRSKETGHIPSLGSLLELWRSLGAIL